MLEIPVDNTMSIAFRIPACATIQPDRRKTMTPKILIKHEVNTPSHMPNNTGSEIKN